MGIDLATLLAGLTGGASGLGQAVVQEDAKKRQQALDAEQTKLHDAQLANLADEQQGRDLARYQQGFRTGTAPDASGILAGMNVGASLTPSVGAAPSAAVLAMKDAASDPRFSPDRFQQVNPSTYVDRTQTPEAVQSRMLLLKEAMTPRPPVMGSPEWETAKVKEAKINAQYGYHPPVQPSFTPVTVQSSSDEPPVIKPFNTKTGEVGPSIGGAKQATKIESATNTAAKARLEAAVSEMNNAHKGMEDYENKLRNGTANINGLQQFASRVANSFTHDDPLSMTIQSTALATLNRTNPELARYIRRALSFAEGESMISQRPSDFRTKMSAFLSAAASGATPEMIHDIESRRTSILNPLNRTVQPGPTQAAAHGQPSGNVDLRTQPTHAQQLWDAAVAKYGEAKVLQEYGPRPNE